MNLGVNLETKNIMNYSFFNATVEKIVMISILNYDKKVVKIS